MLKKGKIRVKTKKYIKNKRLITYLITNKNMLRGIDVKQRKKGYYIVKGFWMERKRHVRETK